MMVLEKKVRLNIKFKKYFGKRLCKVCAGFINFGMPTKVFLVFKKLIILSRNFTVPIVTTIIIHTLKL